MAIFDTIIVLRTDIPDARLDTIVNSVTDLIQSFSKKKKVNINIVGEKRLAFEIAKCNAGYYVLFTYEATKEDVITLEKHLRITDEIIKYLTVKNEEDSDDILDDLEDPTSEHRQYIQDLYPNVTSTKKTEPIDALKIIYGIE